MLKLLEKYRVYLVYVPLILYGIILFILTILPGDGAVKSNSPDKFYHFAAYGLFSFILYFTLFFQNKILLLKKYTAAFTILFASLFGVLNEFNQIFIPGRSANIYDVIANFIGSLVTVLIIKFSLKILKRWNELQN
ncbi:MAG: VanZ family protein [Ignavibacteriaceae bacterium]|nr:VanZ family protein [Ignavibacteriaceae bacterium]